MKTLLTVAVLILSAAGNAEPFLARETAQVGKRWDYSVGVFAPLKLGIADGVELQSHPLLFLVAPNVDVRVAHVTRDGFSLAGEYGFLVPTPLMRLTQGFLFPSKGTHIPWVVVPHAAARASWGNLDGSMLTAVVDFAYGIPLEKQTLTPLGAWPFLEVQMAPIISGHRLQVGALYDYKLNDRFRLRGYADAYLHRATPSVLTLRGGLNVDIRVGKMSRFSIGAVVWNADQHAVDMKTLQRVRSTDFLPTVDFIWAG